MKEIRAITRDSVLVDKRRSQIAQAALHLFVEKGYTRTTMSEIAEQCGIGKGSLYNCVSTKMDLVFMIQDLVVADIWSSLRGAEREASELGVTELLNRCIRAYIESVDRYDDAYNLLNHVVVGLDRKERNYLLSHARKVYAYFEAILVRGVESGEFEVENPRLVAHNIIVLIAAWARSRWHIRSFLTLDGFIREQTECIMTMVVSPAGKPGGSDKPTSVR